MFFYLTCWCHSNTVKCTLEATGWDGQEFHMDVKQSIEDKNSWGVFHSRSFSFLCALSYSTPPLYGSLEGTPIWKGTFLCLGPLFVCDNYVPRCAMLCFRQHKKLTIYLFIYSEITGCFQDWCFCTKRKKEWTLWHLWHFLLKWNYLYQPKLKPYAILLQPCFARLFII